MRPGLSGLLLAMTLALPCALYGAGSTENPSIACPQGYVCLRIKEAANLDRKLITLERDLALAKARGLHRVGWTVGCGPGLGSVVDENLHARVVPTFACGAFIGLRF